MICPQCLVHWNNLVDQISIRLEGDIGLLFTRRQKYCLPRTLLGATDICTRILDGGAARVHDGVFNWEADIGFCHAVQTAHGKRI